MFSKEKINTGRQLELDLARGLAVLFMILIHSQLFFANESVTESAFGSFNDFVGMIPSAPMFMFLLGVGINYTRKNEPRLFIKRGMMLILAGFLLNFLKGFTPSIIRAYNTMDIAYLYEGVAELMYVDILHFSGLAMILFGIFKRFRIGNFAAVLTAIILSLLNCLALTFNLEPDWISSLLGFFWGTNDYAYFPFLTWIFYPIAGLVFGSFLHRCTDKQRFYKLSALVSFIIFTGGTYLFNSVLKIPNGMMTEQGYYHHILTDNITFTALVIFEIALLSFFVPHMPSFTEKIVARWSKNVTPIFFIHWLLITWSALVIPMNSLDMPRFVLYLILLIPLSDFLAHLWLMRGKFTQSL